MAIAYDNATGGSATATNTLTYSHTTGTLTDGVLIVGVGYFLKSASITGITYGGVAMTKRLRYDDGTRQATAEVWYLANPASGANNVVVTKSEATAGLSSVALTLSGVDQTTPIEADNGGNVAFGSHTTHSTTVTTATANAWVVDSLFGTTATPTATSSQTRRASSSALPGGDQQTIGTRGPVATPASETASYSFTSTSNASNLIAVSVKPAATAYTLTASGGTFTLTGTAATLKAGRYLSAAAGTYTLTGTAATLKAGRYLSAGAGAFTLTGADATLIYGSVGAYTLAANGGTFALTGGDASLIAARRLTASSGTFTLTGTDATLKAGRRLTASGGSYTLTGMDATLKAGRVIAADGGTFTLTGTAAALRAARLLSASGGVFALTGTDATLIYGQIGNFTLSAEGGTFTLTGGAAALTAARRLSAAGATYTLTGMDAALRAGRRLVASGGAFTLTGTDADLVYSGARSTAFYVTGRSGVRYQIIEAASEPRYRVTRRE